MPVILKSVSHPDLGEIIINDNLFAVGRHEEPFSSYEPAQVSKLSRRHARIFEQEGAVYVVDLGSLNGTTVNGNTVDKVPVQLQRGDELCFADYLSYQVEILGVAAQRSVAGAAAPPVQLVLIPENHAADLEPVVITQFPFLVSKSSDVFSRYRETCPDEVRYLSRRQAHFFIRNDNLYIEDLGSTNGTFVSGVRLDEQAQILHSGDIVAFGGDYFSYRVRMEFPSDDATIVIDESTGTGQITGQIEGIEDVTRTTFVTSANSFLDIFCIEEEAEDEEEDVSGSRRNGGQSETADERPGFIRRSRTVLREMRGALSEEKQRGSRRKRWIVAAVLMIAVGIVLGTFMYSASERKVKQLLQQGSYTEAAALADRHLQEQPGDPGMEALATEALLNAMIPAWLDQIAAKDFSAAGETVKHAKTLSASNPEGMQILDLLVWATRLEQFFNERGGPGSATVMFEHEEPISDLLAWWERDPKINRRLLGAVAQHVPAFTEMRATIFSQVRTLSSQKSLELAAIERLMTTTRDILDNGEPATLTKVFTEFEKTYPRIVGVDVLRDDLASYLAISQEISEKNWIAARRIVDSTRFVSPVFRDQISRIQEKVLPTDDIVLRYDAASAAWRAGNVEQSFSLLEALTDEQWREVAVSTLGDKREMAGRFEALQQAKGTQTYEEQLLQFYSDLDPEEDVYFAKAVESEFSAQREKALARADEAFLSAKAAWDKYQEQGGIRGLQRLEARVSDVFRKQAKLLTDATLALTQGLRVYRSLNTRYPEEWSELYNRIRGEVNLQRRSLTELAMVLEPSLLKAKLELIPDPKAIEPHR